MSSKQRETTNLQADLAIDNVIVSKFVRLRAGLTVCTPESAAQYCFFPWGDGPFVTCIDPANRL